MQPYNAIICILDLYEGQGVFNGNTTEYHRLILKKGLIHSYHIKSIDEGRFYTHVKWHYKLIISFNCK
jgi:hypothetical protein